MSNVAVGSVLPSDLLAILADPNYATVIGATAPADEPPIVACWPADPIPVAAGLAGEDWGQLHDVWVLNCFGSTVGQALGVRNSVLGKSWGDRWQLVNTSQAIEDTAAVPSWWFFSVRVRSTEVA